MDAWMENATPLAREMQHLAAVNAMNNSLLGRRWYKVNLIEVISNEPNK